MSIEVEPFSPFQYLTLTAAGASVAGTYGTNVGRSLRLYNSGTAVVFADWANGETPTATTTTAYPVPPGETHTVRTAGIDRVAAISAAGTNVLYATRGEGGS